MLCCKSNSVAVEEMKTLLTFIENEISHFEKERNELKAQYQGRPLEEKNIMKDILVMHSDFDSGLSKLKDMVDTITLMPVDKTSKIIQAEEYASQIL